MKKYLIAIAFFLVLGVKLQAATGGLIAGSEADFYTVANATGNSIFVGAGVVDAVCASTGNGTAYTTFYDTSTSASASATALTASANEVIGAITFTSGTVVNSAGSLNAQPICWAPLNGRGVRLQLGLFTFQSSASSGEANRTVIYWRRD